MESKGFSLLQSGRGIGTGGDGGYAYFETEAALGHIIEAIQMSEEMPDPERTYPEGDARAIYRASEGSVVYPEPFGSSRVRKQRGG